MPVTDSIRRGFTLPLLLGALVLGLSLAACSGGGSGDGGDSGGDGGGDADEIVLVLEAALDDEIAAADRGPLMDAIANRLEARATAFGVDDVEVETEGDQITVRLRGGITEEQAREILLARGLVDVRQPALDTEGNVVCQPETGEPFGVTLEAISYDLDDPAGRPLPTCEGEDGQTGNLVWASPTDVSREATLGLPLAVASATVDRTRAAAVFIQLDPQSSVTLQQLTSALVGSPLAIFVDGELMAAPTVQEAISNGLLVVTGLSLPEADILAAQIGSGVLPATLTEVGDD